VYAIGLLVFKIIGVIGLTIFARIKSQSPASPEDRPDTKGEAVGLLSAYDKSGVERALAMHRNDNENTILFLLTFASLFISQPSSVWLLPVYVAIFAVSRVCHSITYMFALQPWRGISFIVGLLDIIVFQIISMVYVL
jgi:uncharacterized membrane protein YecN with MAPEG domain